jgi:hypothetical protein
MSSVRNFQNWLNQQFPLSYEVTCDRRSYLPRFAEDLESLLRSHGYIMDYRWKTGALAVARWIYKIQCDTTTRYPKILHRNLSEDKEQYLHVVTDEILRDFLDLWKHVPDFDQDTKYGRILYDEMQDFLWAYIDVEESPQGIKTMEWLEDSDADSDDCGDGKVDSYLQDIDAGWHKSLR